MSMSISPLDSSPILTRLIPFIERLDQPVYFVGGFVRDLLLGRASHDIDLAVATDAIALTYRLADALGLPAYPLDAERDVGRIIAADQKLTLDIARFRGPDLSTDLDHRDFTINAMALPYNRATLDQIIDPHDGRSDVRSGLIRAVHDRSIADDPVRALRAVRFAVEFGYRLTPATHAAAQAAGQSLAERVSVERIRDELTRLLTTNAPHVGIDLLHNLGLLPFVLPEVADLAGVAQSPPHHEPVLEHTLSTIQRLVEVERWLTEDNDPETDDWRTSAEVELSPYRKMLSDRLDQEIDGGLTVSQLLRWGTLYHDTGKATTQTIDPDGRIRFLGHDEAGQLLARMRLNHLSFSNQAIRHVTELVAGHMRPLYLASAKSEPSRRSVYRFFRAFPASGLEIPLHALADHLATYGGIGDEENWRWLLMITRKLYETYFTAYEETVMPTRLLNGQEIIQLLNLDAGPEIGRLLRLLEEAQAAGEIKNKVEAIGFVTTLHRAPEI